MNWRGLFCGISFAFARCLTKSGRCSPATVLPNAGENHAFGVSDWFSDQFRNGRQEAVK